MAKRAFISHISEEADLAKGFKDALTRDFLGFLTVFVASDSESIGAGALWLQSIEMALEDCTMLIILCSSESINRAWINFEAGAAWIRKIPLIPVCHSGLTPKDLPMPLSLRQAIAVNDPSSLSRLYAQIAQILGCNIPQRDFKALAEELGKIYPQKLNTVRTPQGDKEIRLRLREALNHPNVNWRSIDALASEAGISLEQASEILRGDDEVRFSTGEKGQSIVGLKSRVGELRRIRKI
jgi:hypothetical protein